MNHRTQHSTHCRWSNSFFILFWWNREIIVVYYEHVSSHAKLCNSFGIQIYLNDLELWIITFAARKYEFRISSSFYFICSTCEMCKWLIHIRRTYKNAKSEIGCDDTDKLANWRGSENFYYQKNHQLNKWFRCGSQWFSKFVLCVSIVSINMPGTLKC